jgi:diguanylate cyclase (GGDEF)-like protein
MHLNFGRSGRSDGKPTPPPEPAGAAAPDPGAEPDPDVSLELPVEPPVELPVPLPVAGAAGSADPEPIADEAWPEADLDASPPPATTVRGSRNDEATPVTVTAPMVPTGWTDQMTSADGPHYWDRLISSERDRIRRYHRPATIVFLELGNLDELGALWGDDVAAQSLIKVGRTLMQEIRSSDHAARIDLARFAVFLPETNEIAAINFVERVRAAIDASLGFMDQTLVVGIGWASPADGNIDVALAIAEQRLDADLGRS